MLSKLGFCCCCSVLAMAGAARAQTTAVPVSAFLGSLGVNTHVAQGYSYENYVPALQYLGISVVRDAAGNIPNLVALHQQTGVLIDIFNAADLPGILSAGQTLAAAGALLSFEGPNEPNNFPIKYDGQTGGGTKTWVPVADFQRDLYSNVKARYSPAGLSGVPRLGGGRRDQQCRYAVAHHSNRSQNRHADRHEICGLCQPA